MRQQSILLMDAGAESMAVLAARIQRLGCRALRVKTPEEALPVLSDRRFSVDALVVPPDLPVPDLGRTLVALRLAAGRPELPFLAAGSRPPAADRARLARAGVALPIWEPINAHTLRFQLNRAMAGAVPARRQRQVRRAPSSLEVFVRAQRLRRRKSTRLYTFSAHGAFLATDAPSLRGSELMVELGIPGVPRRIPSRVVMTNVAGNLRRANLPRGMAVRFQGLSAEVQAGLELLVEKILRRLTL